MRLSQLTPESAAELAIRTLGLDPDRVELSSTAGVAASLRRAASFLCPTSPGRLVDVVLSAVRPVLGDATPAREDVAQLVDLLVATGDLLVLRHGDERPTRLLYLGPPSFIELEPGTFLLIGIRPHGASLIDEALGADLECEGHARLLRRVDSAADLTALGLHKIDRRTWVASPWSESASDLVERLRVRLDVAASSGTIGGLQILDPAKSPRFYAGRWRPPMADDSGDRIARRPQAYGADLWCLVRLRDGCPQRMLEFPIENPVLPGRDEAWRFQAAIDALSGRRQRFRLRPASGNSGDAAVLGFFSPLPSFAERYLQLVGIALGRTPGTLFSYRVPKGAIDSATTLLTDKLWMGLEEAWE